MKKALFTVLVTLVCTIAAANPITRQQALQKATAFMKTQNPLATLNATPVHKAPRRVGAQVSTDQAYYYVFNANDGKGFVIASGDDVAVPILGYSDTGTFNEDEIPDNMRAWLHGYELEIQWAIEHGYQPAPDATTTTPANNIFAGDGFKRDSSPLFAKKNGRLKAPKNDIEPMVKCNWDQGDPYNIQCPQYDGKFCYTGCVATAMAQIMYYWGCTKGNASLGCKALPAYTTETRHITVEKLDSVSKFSWMMMGQASPTISAQKSNVAKLMRYCGQAVKMDYDTSASGALSSDIPAALVDYFGYDNGLRYVFRTDYSASEWEDLIYNELANGRPVLFDGLTINNNIASGHEFVCDGYQLSTNKFYFNWGWSGISNGYFALNALQPNSIGTGGAAGNYAHQSAAIIGIKPTTSGDEPVLANDDQLFIDNLYLISPKVNERESRSQNVEIRLRGICFNLQSDSMTYDNCLGVYDAKGKLIDLITPRAYKIAPQGGFYFNHDFEFGAEMPYGTYKLLPISRINGAQEWLPMLGASARYLKLVVEEKKITATPSQSIKINSITSTGSSTRGYTNTFNITNDGAEEFTSAAYVLAASSSGNMANIGLLEPVGLKPGQTASVSVYSDAKVTINAQTSPWVLVIGDSNFNGFYYNSYANYAEADWDLAWQGYIDDDNNYYSDTYKATFIIDNMSCNNAYNHDVTLTLFEKGKDPSKGITLKKNINISAKTRGEAEFVFDKVETGKTYDLQFTFYNEFSDTTNVISNYGIELTMAKGTVIRNNDGFDYFNDEDGSFTVPEGAIFVDARYSDKANLIGDGGNVNTLYLLKAGTSVPETLTGKNIVLGNTAQNIVMTDTMEFYSPIDFTAQNISFKRTFETGRDETTPHWSTLMLPFDVQSVTTGDKAIDWYHSADDADKEFWLMDFTGETDGKADFAYTSTIEANHPYIIAVPSNTWGSKWNLVGKELTFSGQNANIKAEGPKAVLDRGGKYDFIGRTILTTHADKYDLNEQGSTFEYITDDYYFYSLPFQAYFVAYTDLGTQSNVELAMPMPLPTPAQTMVGDVNGDETVTIADVTALVNIILGKDETHGSTNEAADVNKDGSITIADVTALVNIILGKN